MSIPAEQLRRWQEKLEAALPRWLPRFLPRQRWFGRKALTIRETRLADTAWLEGTAPHALVVVEVDFAEGQRERYSMLLGLLDSPGGLPELGRWEETGGSVHVVEAALEPEGLRSLLRGLDPPREISTATSARLRYGDVEQGSDRALHREALEAVEIRALGIEQSNTSLALGRSHMFKLFRKLERGENPELDILRFLTTHTSFRAMPGLRGSLSYVSAAGETTTLGMLLDWVDSLGDGWKYTLARLREILGEAAAPEPLTRDLLVLGVTTGELHNALASDADSAGFAPEPATRGDVAVWVGSFRERAAGVSKLVERHLDVLPEQVRALGKRFLHALPEIDERLAARAAREPGFRKIRVHGDYHLGQTLKTPTGFVLIDFEGEPARSIAERYEKQCALKDVAGMVRSFDYAVETVRAELPESERIGGPPPPLREAFLEGYLSRTFERGVAFLPDERQALEAWLDFYELDKALYEVEYEINHRPHWLHIPIRGTLRILERKET